MKNHVRQRSKDKKIKLTLIEKVIADDLSYSVKGAFRYMSDLSIEGIIAREVLVSAIRYPSEKDTVVGLIETYEKMKQLFLD